jgi:hypothetical protein
MNGLDNSSMFKSAVHGHAADPRVFNVTDAKKRRGPISATDLMVELANDPEYQRKKLADETQRQIRVHELSRAEQPIVADLRAAGVEVNSVWDLVNTADPYPSALPVLCDHLQQGGYPDRVMESLGRALAVKPSRPMWWTLRNLYLSAEGPGEETGLALSLAASATPDLFDDVLALMANESRDDSRIVFLKTLVRLNRKRGREVVLSLQDDELFGREARFMAKRCK